MKPTAMAGSAAAAVAVALTVACSSPTGSCEVAGGIVGQWNYQATQESPRRGTVAGSLVIASSNCADFQGVMDVVETLSSGESRRIAGPVSGTLIDQSLVQFEASVGGGNRAHFARLAGDSITGSWVESSGTAVGTGQFTGRRQPAN